MQIDFKQLLEITKTLVTGNPINVLIICSTIVAIYYLATR